MPAIAFPRFRDEILSIYQRPPFAKKTHAKLKQVLGEFESLGSIKKTSDLNPLNISRWIGEHPDRKPITAHSLLRSLRAACSYAKTMKYLSVDPFDWKTPSEWLKFDQADDVEDFDRHRTAREIAQLLALLDREAAEGSWESGRLKALVYTFAFTGMRKMEALGLLKTDVDVPNRVIFIRSNPRRKLKTKGSGQPVGISDELAYELDLWMPRTGCEWLFPGKTLVGPWVNGGPGVRPLDQIKAAGERSGVPGLTMLAFRHTIGTLAEGWGVGELELQRWLRHTRRRTQDAYRKKGDIAVIVGTARKINFRQDGDQSPPCPKIMPAG
jgi:integrase